MRWRDLIEMSLASLRQRRFRTALTALGVVIGTMSVVVMVSLGLGMSRSVLESAGENSSYTRVSVLPNQGSTKKYKLDAETINDLSARDGVTHVTPVYDVPMMARVGNRTGSVTVSAMAADDLARRNLQFSEGHLPGAGDGLAFAVGSAVGSSFGEDLYTSQSDIDFMAQPMLVRPSSGQGQGAQGGGQQNQAEASAPASGQQESAQNKSRRIVVPVTGMVKRSASGFSDEDRAIYCDFGELVGALRRANPGKALPGQPANAKGGPKGPFVYSHIDLDTGSVEQAEALSQELRSAGYSVQSNVELMRELQKQSVLVQGVFGGIGFISLFVAAIGIANTMMMSVYERTRQIGIMKVLGAAIRDIRRAFLAEAAMIGFLGGVAGLLLSLLSSAVLNATLGASTGSKISVITPWMGVGAIVFSTLIGTVAGLIPAQRAMRLSPLAALRAE
ncbi:ABC transporter permease [Propionibacterium australiense]|uniref:FtsX-like permease family n=1 Tax=Propionibacterium australiense TaxID=119981 RepID=A0A383S767_9ACTN|nr:ABC transporter permease [Propionibacterium australiense]RLP09513.1 FtsX-like permease family protein [Propionibacterium australiense]RLP09907.1 FtsX-like permease family protein [Propionibacterium australiense]SYZ33818.1 FtsX-like permease family [Propionibacterium australiense]VEH91953.1 Macrolide export ATP-binding/permease protein MacB [Propionibacterium australiense]